MNPENEIDKMPRRAESPSVEKVSAWLAALIIVLGLFLFAKWWRDGSNRATCVMNIRNFQTGARSYTGMESDKALPRHPVDSHAIYSFMGSPGRRFSPFECPSGGTYTVHGTYGDPPGTVFLHCSHPDHVPTPAQAANW